MWKTLAYVEGLVTLVLCNIHGSLEHEIPRRSFLSRRAIDGTRGRKYFDPEEEGAFDSYGSAGGQYDPYEERTDFSDIRRNVPGEPGVDYPAYTTLPQTGFTCEGRSRGYYGDEVAGCQVFHVCHDVLVSSFLCPIGSIFSQKLLTCDWWTKVDCSSSEKYIGVNRNSYQQDDDEMIRNAYAMISLQSGTDVTKDGLVDPDRTGSVVDYQRGTGRMPDYTPVDSTGNDLRSNFEDYSRPVVRDFLPPYQFKERKPDTDRSYQERFYPQEKSRSPYQDSPIIRVQKVNDRGQADQQRTRDFQGSYRRPNEFGDQFQPSYAPTVPTVTTTTRRFYSPTVPTTFRPSTLAYNNLDQVLDSSDYFFSHSGTKSYVTPPTRVFPNDDESRGSYEQTPKKTTYTPRKVNREEYTQPESYEDDYGDANSEEERNDRPRERFQVRVAEDLRFNRTNVENDRDSSFDEAYRGFQDKESVDDIETRDSIGLGHALRQPFRGISVQEQNPVNERAKGGEFDSVVDESTRSNTSAHSSHIYEGKVRVDYQYILGRSESTASVGPREEETTEQYQRDDQRRSETFVPSTTPSFIESTIRASTIDSSINRDEATIKSSATNVSSNLKSNFTDDGTESWKGTGATDKMDTGLHAFRPPEILNPPETTRSKFQIKVPDLSEVSSLLVRYSTIDDEPSPGTRTTELPRFQNTYSDDYVDQPTAYDETIGVTSNYDSSSRYRSTTEAKSLISSTGPWFSPSSSGDLIPEISRDVSPPVNYNDFSASESKLQFTPKNKTEEKVVNDYNNGQFNVRDTVPGLGSKVPCSEQSGNACNASSTKEDSGSTLTTLVQTRLEKTKATTVSSSHSIGSTVGETATQRLRTIEIEPLESISKPLSHRSVDTPSGKLEVTDDKGDPVETSTVNALLRSIKSETLKHIEESIDRNNSPYQVTLTVNKDEGLVPTDLIGKLISHQGKESSSFSDKLDELEIIKSVEPEIETTTDLQTTTVNNLDIKDRSNVDDNFTVLESPDSKKRNFTTVSLLQLMSELLRLDRAPRPFSLDTHRPEPRTQPLWVKTIAKDLNFSMQLEDSTKSQESSTESVAKTHLPLLKEQILGRLMENFGEPIYSSTRQPVFDLPKEDRSLDFQTGLPLNRSDRNDDSIGSKTTVKEFSKPSTRVISTTTTTPTPRTTPTTEPAKTVVKTEFVPSIGFSLDTNEGREEYVEAVLGGLIEPESAESEKKETIVSSNVEEPAKNETSVKV